MDKHRPHPNTDPEKGPVFTLCRYLKKLLGLRKTLSLKAVKLV